MKNRAICIVMVALSTICYSQIVTAPIDIDSHIEKLLLSKGEEADNQSYFDLLMQFYNNPININKCTSDELDVLQILNDEQLFDIIDYRNSQGNFTSKYELLSIESLSIQDIKSIVPFISFAKPVNVPTLLKTTINKQNNYVLASGSRIIENEEGFRSNRFNGDPYQYSVRLKFVNPGHTSLGITLQKDPGELLLRNDSLHFGPDFSSFHYYIQNQGAIKQLAIGDYKLQFGQGLLLGAGFLIGKNANSITSIQTTLKVQPYTSLTEFKFFRGIGATISLSNNLDLSLFYSQKALDASTNSSQSSFSSLRTSGLHRTLTEVMAQNAISEKVAGTAITFTNRSVEAGLIALYNHFSLPYSPNPILENSFRFNGQENYNISIFGRYNYQNFTFYGEAAQTINNGSAINAGIITSLSKSIDFSFQFRSLDPNFHSFYGSSFAENSILSNERGAYWGIKVKLTPSFTIMAYFDMYTFPWLKSTIPQPVKGNDGLVRVSYKLNKLALFYTQVQTEQKDKSLPGPIIKEAQKYRLIKYVLNLDYNLESPITFRSRLQWTKSYFSQNEVGTLIYQDINVNLSRVTISGRYAIFDTDGFLSRQYMYEKGMLYSFNTPQFSGKGIRYYLLAKYSPFKGLAVRTKWSQTIYYDRVAIGTVSSKIEGNKKSQITLQVKYDF